MPAQPVCTRKPPSPSVPCLFRCMASYSALTGTSRLLWRWLLIHGLILRWSFADLTPRWVHVPLEEPGYVEGFPDVCVGSDGWVLSLTSQNKKALEFMKKVTYYSMDEEILRKMLTEENAIDWSTYFLIGGEFWALQRWTFSTLFHFELPLPTRCRLILYLLF